jgi:zinc transport system ATP-binding protein
MKSHGKLIVECRHVTFRYPGAPLTALENVTFSVRGGEYTGLIGGNGSGKTTLLKILLGLLSPEHGEVRLFETPLSEFRDWHKVGYVPQNVFREEEVFPATVREVVGSGTTAFSSPWEFWMKHGMDLRALDEALHLAEISHLAERKIGELSGGERQRVFIARALLARPELLILDEPLTGVDSVAQEKFYQLLKKLDEEQGIAIILVSHDLEAVTQEVENLLCLHRTLICAGSPKKIDVGNLLDAYAKKGLILHDHAH